MLALNIGLKSFQESVRKYVSKNSLRSVSVDDFVSELPPDFAIPLKEALYKWLRTNQQIIVKVERNYANTSTVNISHLENADQYLPITLSSARDKNLGNVAAKVWLLPGKQIDAMKIEPSARDNEWIVVNNRASGFYRVLYDKRNWALLVKQLREKNHTEIHPLNRAQLIDDAVHFAKKDLLPFDTVFELLSYLRREKEFIPWATAERALEFLERMLRGSKEFSYFEKFMRNISSAHYAKYKITGRIVDAVGRLQRLRIAKFACEFGTESCIIEMIKSFNGDVRMHHIQSTAKSISYVFRSIKTKPKSSLK